MEYDIAMRIGLVMCSG